MEREILEEVAKVMGEYGVKVEAYSDIPQQLSDLLKMLVERAQKGNAMSQAAWRKNTFSGY